MDTCPDMHGFWLDNGEEKEVDELMKDDKKAYERKIQTENKWDNHLAILNSSSFLEKVKNYLYL